MVCEQRFAVSKDSRKGKVEQQERVAGAGGRSRQQAQAAGPLNLSFSPGRVMTSGNYHFTETWYCAISTLLLHKLRTYSSQLSAKRIEPHD